MTENEAIKEIEHEVCNEKGKVKLCYDKCMYGKEKCAYSVAIRALQEIQQYRSIGTVEDCRAAMEKQTLKTPNIYGDGYDNEGNMIYDMYECPCCGTKYEIDYDDYKYCPECGQAIDRSDLV